jgi:DNA polymerase I
MDMLISEMRRLFLLPDAQRYHWQAADGGYPPTGSAVATLKTIDAAVLDRHLQGRETVALNLVSPEGLSRVAVLDFDGHQHGQGDRDWRLIRDLVDRLPADLGIPRPAVSLSGGKGYGVWFSFTEPMPVGQVRAFVRLLRAVYLSGIPDAELDLRPDTDVPTIAAQAVVKLPPCLHRRTGRWSVFVDPATVDRTPEPGLPSPPDMGEQARVLAGVEPIATGAFLIALQRLGERAGAARDFNGADSGPKHAANLARLPAGQHPPCVATMIAWGVPHEIQYNIANLNLAAYAQTRGLSLEEGERIARAVADASEGHPSSKGTAEKVRNFLTTMRGEKRIFHCDYPRNIRAWREQFDPDPIQSVCRECAACPAGLFASDKPSSQTRDQQGGETYFGNTSYPVPRGFVLEDMVALELLAATWNNGTALPQIRRVWPQTAVTIGEQVETVPLAMIASRALTGGAPSNAAVFRELDLWIAGERMPEDRKARLRTAARPLAEAFLEKLHKVRRDLQTDAAQADVGEAALERALHLERRATLVEETAAALTAGPEVGANTVAMNLRRASEGALHESGGGPLAGLRKSLFANLAETTLPTVPTPFPGLTRLLHGGWRGGRLYALLAPPKAGKTTLTAVALDHAAAAGHPALYVGYEMAREQLVEYALARRCRINSGRIERRDLSEEEARRVAESLDQYLANEGRYLELVEAGLQYTVADMAAWALAARARHPDRTPLIVVDYLQLARVGDVGLDNHQSETKRVSAVAVACKDLARQTGAAVVALSSVTKEAEVAASTEGFIDVTAARDSLAIIHAADGVLTLQTSTFTVEEGKGDQKVQRPVDPWAFVAHHAASRGDQQHAANVERGLSRLDAPFPQNGPGVATRARLSLTRHRGATGDVLLYYRRAYHDFEEVDLPGVTLQDRAELHSPEAAAAVFREYVEKDVGDTDSRGSMSAARSPASVEDPKGEGPSIQVSTSLPDVAYRLVTTAEEARAIVADYANRGVPLGVDMETTGLDPLTASARLLQLAPADGPVTVIDLPRTGGLGAIRDPLQSLRGAVAHNATFDMGFLWGAGVDLVPDCTLLANHVLTGLPEKLRDLAALHLGVELDKTEQTSDWSGDLSEAQLRYAALDARTLLPLQAVLMAKVAERDSDRVYGLLRAAQPAIVEMQRMGMPFDVEAQRNLVDSLTVERDRLKQALAAAVDGLNPNSGPQIADWLTSVLGGPGTTKHAAWPKTATGKLATGADDLKKGLAILPADAEAIVRDLLLPYKVVEKSVSTYGANFERHVHPVTGRIHARFNLAGAVTGRMSSASPNMQNIPRDATFRGLFKAPPGRKLVIADYSQMELRVAAILAGEITLLAAYEAGQDTHAVTAARLLGKDPAAVTKGERQLAKAVNFGLLYGQGAKGLQEYAAATYGVEISEETARKHRAAWFEAFPAFAQWHQRTASTARRALAVRTPAGRERRWESADRKASGGFRETEAYNTPVQGGAAEAMLAALGRLAPRLRAEGLDARPVAVVHDEVIVEASATDAPMASRVLEESMAAGMLDVFPEAATRGLVEARIGQSWADK